MAKTNPLALGLERTKPVSASAGPAVRPQPDAEAAAPSRRTPSREGQILVGGFFAPEVHRQLKVLAAESGVTQQGLIAEALNMLFAKHGKPQIAELGRILRSA